MIASKLIINKIENVVGRKNLAKPIALHEPDLSNTFAWDYVKDCLDSGWVSTAGKWVNIFEEELCKQTKSKHSIAVSNGTVALRLALHLVGVKAGDEVLLPPLTFVATANAIAHLGAIPHFIDIESNTLGMCPESLSQRLNEIGEYRQGKVINRQTGRAISAIILVHVFGHPANAPAIAKVSKEWKLPLIEDAAEALGSWRSHMGANTHCGLFGNIGTISFNGNKLITTGGGGALITNDSNMAKKARHLSTTAKKTHPWEFDHDQIGWNDRLPNLNAALGFAQLEILTQKLQIKRQLMERYFEEFEKNSLKDLKLLIEPKNCRSNYWLNTLRFCDEDLSKAQEQKKALLEQSHKRGLLVRPCWKLLNTLPMYQNSPCGVLNVATNECNRLINLPSSTQLLS